MEVSSTKSLFTFKSGSPAAAPQSAYRQKGLFAGEYFGITTKAYLKRASSQNEQVVEHFGPRWVWIFWQMLSPYLPSFYYIPDVASFSFLCIKINDLFVKLSLIIA